MQVFVNRNIVLMFSLSEKVEFFMIGLVWFVFCRKWWSGSTRVKSLGKCMVVGMMVMLQCFWVLQRSLKSMRKIYRFIALYEYCLCFILVLKLLVFAVVYTDILTESVLVYTVYEECVHIMIRLGDTWFP